ncbi:6-phosphogluconolactonase [Natronocella acetinitrilica]|uniref:6-phosphogluconolactonase n=1 Tax=Natronocella acetinitrilica TaxID=414046 RepID=A0AAE3G483_9GAMM|nr:6-phosphogluconolactonase [Natronocella acetinitrilica]MCP1674888.1 6-phosphogluconolactonase [Natronocella acetinitrilica]
MANGVRPPRVMEHRFKDRNSLAGALAADVCDWLGTGLSARPRASLIVSGGSTPLPLFHALRDKPLAWERIDVTLADERWVSPDHADSNERLVRQELLQAKAAAARFIPLKTTAATPEQGLSECEARLDDLPRPLDVVILGMGGDGHTASLFPGSEALAKGLDPEGIARCVACTPGTAPYPRLSLSISTLLNARRVVLHIVGADKWAVYRQACEAGEPSSLPIRAVLHQNRVQVDVYWSP